LYGAWNSLCAKTSWDTTFDVYDDDVNLVLPGAAKQGVAFFSASFTATITAKCHGSRIFRGCWNLEANGLGKLSWKWITSCSFNALDGKSGVKLPLGRSILASLFLYI
jgi:hypothetical protein